MNHRLVLGGIVFVFVATLMFLVIQNPRIKPQILPESKIIVFTEQQTYVDPCTRIHTISSWTSSYERGTPKPTPDPIPTKCINGVPTP